MKVLTGASLAAVMAAVMCAAPVSAHDSAQESASDQSNATAAQGQAYLGVGLMPTHPMLRGHYSELLGDSEGAMVGNVMAKSPAAEAGLREYDVVTGYNGKKVDSPRNLVEMVRNSKPGDDITLAYLRNGQVNETQLKLGDKPAAWPQVSSPAARSPFGKGAFSMRGFDPDRFPGFDPDKFRNFDFSKFPGVDFEKFGIDMDNFTIPSDSLPSAWNSFQSMAISKQADGTYQLKLDMRDGDNNTIKREYNGTREQLREAVEGDEELPQQTRELVLRSLDKGGSIQWDWNQRQDKDDDSGSSALEF